MVGVVEHGLFPGIADPAIIAGKGKIIGRR
jgi:ribose 5-phosphate isomerase